MYCNKENVNILTSLLVAHGVRHVVVCPGSRNAPLVHNFAECPDIVCHPVTDERSAGFIAMGIRIKTQEPVAVCVTSGSALLNVLPAAAEATYQRQGIIVISADRPQQWIDQLDGQTLPQPDALGRFSGKSVNLPEPHDDEERWYCNRLVNEVLVENKKSHHPSVHINVPITEPLFEFCVEKLPEERTVTYHDGFCDELETAIVCAKRPLVVIGQMAYSADTGHYIRSIDSRITVLSEPLSSDYNSLVDQMLFHIADNIDDYLPDLIIYIGGHTVSKRLRQFVRRSHNGVQTDVWMLNPTGELQDVTMQAAHVMRIDDRQALEIISCICRQYMLESKSFHRRWKDLRKKVIAIHKEFRPSYSGMLAVKMFEDSIDEAACVHYANSMSVRLASVYARHYGYCNRGVNGIEGSLSAAAGMSLASPERVYCVIGDLSFFYDENALWQQQLGGNFRILLLNNGQGAIFRNLHGLEKSGVRDEYVSASHSVGAEGVCKQFAVAYLRATDEQSLTDALHEFLTMESDRPVLLEVLTAVDDDERVFKDYYRRLK